MKAQSNQLGLIPSRDFHRLDFRRLCRPNRNTSCKQGKSCFNILTNIICTAFKKSTLCFIVICTISRLYIGSSLNFHDPRWGGMLEEPPPFSPKTSTVCLWSLYDEQKWTGHDLISISGVLGSVILTKVRGEIKTRNLDSLKKCQTGLEVHFKEAQGCYGNQKAPIARRTKRRPCGICFVCSSTRVLIGRDWQPQAWRSPYRFIEHSKLE